MKKHHIRIVGGLYRKTPIPVISASGLRPTPDRVRETLFNWLQHLWGGAFGDKRVLDLFAGTGALGFEAASRGVAEAHLVESNRAAVAAMEGLQDRLRAHHVHIHAGDARSALGHLHAPPFDLIFLDPPFGLDWFPLLWERVPQALAPHGFVYAESGVPLAPPPAYDIVRQARAGQVHFCLLRFNPSHGSQEPA